ncbi:MAG: insulinase family protein [Pyrinomonadaceae bacterium]
MGTEDSNKEISRDDMMKFWSAGYVPQNSALIVAGDVTEQELRSLAEKHWGKWTGQATSIVRPEVGTDAARRIVIVDKPGAPQTALRVGKSASRARTRITCPFK